MRTRRLAKKAVQKTPSVVEDDDEIRDQGRDDKVHQVDKGDDEEFHAESSPSEDIVSVPESDEEPKQRRPTSKRRKIVQQDQDVEDVEPPESLIRSRGIFVPAKTKIQADPSLIQGPYDGEDVEKFAEIRATWATYTTIPTRSNEDDEREPSNEVAEWLRSYLKLSPGKGQEPILSNSKAFAVQKQTPPQHFLLGPLNSQRVFRLEIGQSISLIDETFPSSEKDTQNEEGNADGTTSGKRGWMLNIGGRILSIDWCAGKEQSSQFLAIAAEKTSVLEGLNGFKPHPGRSSNIQIWQIRRGEDGMETCRHALDITANWDGSPRELKWCQELKNVTRGSEEQAPLQLLAGVWSDGSVHVMRLELDAGKADERREVCAKKGLFDLYPDRAVYTCIAWLPNFCLAAGSADGTVWIWNVALELTSNALKASLTTTIDLSPTPVPFFHAVLHESYVNSITSTAPEYPFHIATTSMDGYTTLTDIRNSQRDTISANRNRTAPSTIRYHRPTQSILAPDDAGFIRLLPIRRFYTGAGIGKVPAQVLSLATSLIHSSIAIGCTDGSVVITNPILKYNNNRHGINWQQIWFRHEWAHVERIADRELAESIRQDHGATSDDSPRPGLVRFVEGFKAEKQISSGKAHAIQTTKGEGLLPTTIYEVETSVTALAWNPNNGWETWLAAGMGSGLVRIEDVGQDE